MTPSSGNVFVDLGLPGAIGLDVRVRLAVEINRLIKEQQLTRAAAAKRLKVGLPNLSSLKQYKLDGLSAGRLLSFLLALGQDVAIRVSPRRAIRATGRIVVSRVSAATARRARTLYRPLSDKGNPRLDTLAAILAAFGLRLCVRPAAKGKARQAEARTAHAWRRTAFTRTDL